MISQPLDVETLNNLAKFSFFQNLRDLISEF